MYGLKNYKITVLDDQGFPITPQNVDIKLAGTQTSATVYADDLKTSLRNPIVAPASPEISFWSAESTHDIIVKTDYGNTFGRAVTPAATNVTINRNIRNGQLLYVPGSVGAELVEVCGTFVDFPNTYTIPAEQLTAGATFHINGYVLAADFHTQEELDIKVLWGTEVLLQTGDVVIAADDDVIMFDIYVTVWKAGASGIIQRWGKWLKDLNGTITNYTLTNGGAAKAGASEDMSSDITIKVQGDYKNAHADQEAYCFFIVERIG